MIASFDGVAKWYGEVIGLIDVSVEVEPGVTGLLGPNGAGKSTFLKLLTGQLRPSQGRVRLLECDPFLTPRVLGSVGFCPEPDAFYDDMSGLDFVRHLTRLQGFDGDEAKRRALAAIERVGLGDAMRRKIRTYSKGMRQRAKLAQAIAHDPDVLVLDEPLTGMDPVGRKATVDLIRELGENGAAVLVSSHVLHEVEAMTSSVVLLYRGRVRAVGSLKEIRAHLNDYPHKILLRSPQARELARILLQQEAVVAVRLDRDHDDLLHLETHDPDALYDWLPELVLDHGHLVTGLAGEDLGLDAIFEYLVS